jgi:hypothetical protein
MCEATSGFVSVLPEQVSAIGSPYHQRAVGHDSARVCGKRLRRRFRSALLLIEDEREECVDGDVAHAVLDTLIRKRSAPCELRDAVDLVVEANACSDPGRYAEADAGTEVGKRVGSASIVLALAVVQRFHLVDEFAEAVCQRLLLSAKRVKRRGSCSMRSV